MNLKLRNLRSLAKLFIILVSLTRSLHFAGMPMVADERGVGVKNNETLPTS